MKFKAKPLDEQVIVITGATSGIGLTTSRRAAAAGARMVLVSRNHTTLLELAREIVDSGGSAAFVVADVASREALEHVSETAREIYGRIDTWVNNAGVSIYGKLEEVEEADSRRLFDTNFWGVVNGSLVAAAALRETGGTIINLGSTLSDVAIPLQGMYCASKHALRGFTDAFRMEIEADDLPVNVSLVKPAAIDTPYKDHAKSYLDVEPQNPPPVYSPDTVADAILHCAVHPVRDIFVGGGAKAFSASNEMAPRLTDLIIQNTMIDMQKTEEPAGDRPVEGLYASRETDLNERGGYSGHVSESSVYTKASMHPVTTGLLFAGVGLGAAYLLGSNRGAKRAQPPTA